MLLLEPPKSGDLSWSTPRGEIRCWALTPDVLALRLSGHLEKDVVPRFRADFDKTWSGALRGLCVDLGEMTGYDSAFRQGMTEWARQMINERNAVLHVYMKSKIVQMGVAVANLALGGVLQVHPSKAALERAAQQLIKP